MPSVSLGICLASLSLEYFLSGKSFWGKYNAVDKCASYETFSQSTGSYYRSTVHIPLK